MILPQDVIKSAGKLGWANMQLSPLAAEEGVNSAPGSRAGSAAAVEADDEVLIAQLREQLVARLRVAPQQAQGNADAVACLQVSQPTRTCTRLPPYRHTVLSSNHPCELEGYAAHATSTM